MMAMQSVDVAEQSALAWRQLYMAYSTLFKAVERAIAPTGVTLPQALALATIHSSPTPVTPSRLAHELTQETQSVTGLIDRMEKQEWVRRVRDLPDRRAIRLELTPLGAEKLAETRAPSAISIERLFERLSSADIETLARLLSSLTDSAPIAGALP